MAAMINRNYTLCRDVDFKFELPICEVKEEVGDTSHHAADRLPALHTPCPDGTWNRTCYPRSTPGDVYHMNCVCQSFVPIPGDVRDTYWSDFETLTPPVNGVFYTRNLTMEGGQCITQELIKMGPVVSSYGLPDTVTVYTSSSIYSGHYYEYKARLDFLEAACAWRPSASDPDPWLGITLPNDYIIKGSLFDRTCFPDDYVTIATVSTSYDDVTWHVVADKEDVSTLYDADDQAYIWFTGSYISRYWKIYLKDGAVDPHVKADLIGSLVL